MKNYTSEQLKEIIVEHGEWLKNEGESRADLRDANLQYADLQYADLQYADLRHADLQYADLQYADLQYADLQYADLRHADLRDANLRSADLRSADLRSADLRSADLQYANLQYANLRSADLQYANLRDVNLRYANLRYADLRYADLPAPTMVLLANWGQLSDISIIKLMRFDASAHPDKEAFCRWANDGPCPYNDVKIQRVVNFDEKKELWSPGPPPTIWEAMKMVLDEKCPDWDKP